MWSHYPYLFTNLITLALVHLCARLFLPPAQRRLVLLSGLMSTPASPLLYFLEGQYWSPTRLGGLVLGLEDIICTYDVSALLYLLIALGWSQRLTANIAWGVMLRRYVGLAALNATVFLIGYWLGLRGMTSLLVTQLLILPLLFWLKSKSWPLVLKSLMLYPLVYFLLVRCYFWIWPHFLNEWNLAGPWGGLLANLPLGEILWSLEFALWWPLFFSFVCGIELVDKRQSESPPRIPCRRGPHADHWAAGRSAEELR